MVDISFHNKSTHIHFYYEVCFLTAIFCNLVFFPAFWRYDEIFSILWNIYCRVIFCIASFYSSPLTNSRKFAKELTAALQEMRELYKK